VLDAVEKHETDKFLSEVAIEQLSILVLSGSNSVVVNVASTITSQMGWWIH